jgi:PAS domain S-box-containing protein
VYEAADEGFVTERAQHALPSGAPPVAIVTEQGPLVVWLRLWALIGGAVSLAGWVADVPRLTDWFNRGISIQPNTALAAFVGGASLVALAVRRRQAARALGVLVALIGATALFQTVTGISLGIDTLLQFGRSWGHTSVVATGRMGPPAAVSLIFIGVAQLIATLPSRPTRANIRLHAASPGLAGLAVVIATMSIVGYMFGASALYTIPAATAIAAQTATFILALSLGTILAVPEYGPSRLMYHDGMAGTMFRRMLPAIVLVPLVLGYLRFKGQELGYYDLAFGTAARTVAEIAILILFVWLAAGDVNQVERERRAVEDKLVESEALLRTVTEEAEVGLVIIDRDHTYLYANRSYAEIIGADASTLVGRHVREVLPEVYEWRIRPKVEAAFAGETVQYELELPERKQFVQVTYQPAWRDGVVDRLIVAIVDTTQRRLVEETLKESRAELQLAAKRKDQFLMTLAHELRNPLAPIRTAVDLMKQAGATDDMTRPREVIDRQLKLMVRLLDDLLDVGRIERDTLVLRKTRIDLGTVVRHATEISQPLADRFQQQIVVKAPAQPIEVEADSARIEQVVANLLNNACRFTPTGGRIDVSVSLAGSQAVIKVRDNGIGIPPEDLSRIFEMFEQLDRSSERAQGGLGIGLHLVKRLVEMHGGTVEAKSDGIASGSEFTVRLPVAPPLPKDTQAKPAEATGLGAPVVSPKKILVVDDNIDAAEAMSMLLSVIGHDTRVAHDGPQALDAVRDYAPDVVLLDLGLPGMSGFDVCEQIRKTALAKMPLVVALTGWGQESDRKKTTAAGFDHHLVKPVDYDALADLLDKSAR